MVPDEGHAGITLRIETDRAVVAIELVQFRDLTVVHGGDELLPVPIPCKLIHTQACGHGGERVCTSTEWRAPQLSSRGQAEAAFITCRRSAVPESAANRTSTTSMRVSSASGQSGWRSSRT